MLLLDKNGLPLKTKDGKYIQIVDLPPEREGVYATNRFYTAV